MCFGIVSGPASRVYRNLLGGCIGTCFGGVSEPVSEAFSEPFGTCFGGVSEPASGVYRNLLRGVSEPVSEPGSEMFRRIFFVCRNWFRCGSRSSEVHAEVLTRTDYVQLEKALSSRSSSCAADHLHFIGRPRGGRFMCARGFGGWLGNFACCPRQCMNYWERGMTEQCVSATMTIFSKMSNTAYLFDALASITGCLKM